jgi:RNA polymerase sigma-70 factor, ECF subfamily
MGRPELQSGPSQREAEFLGHLTRHKHGLFTLIFCIVRSLPDAEDVFQQTALALWADYEKFQDGGNFMAWASQLARHRAWNFMRSKRRERVFFSETLVAELQEVVEFRFDSADVQESRLQALAKCRQKLSEVDQALLLECYGPGSIHEAARRIGRPVKAVYDSLGRIRRALYDCIERSVGRQERGL